MKYSSYPNNRDSISFEKRCGGNLIAFSGFYSYFLTFALCRQKNIYKNHLIIYNTDMKYIQRKNCATLLFVHGNEDYYR